MTKEYDRYCDDQLTLTPEQFFARYGHSKEFMGAFEAGREAGRNGNIIENPYQANDARMEYERGHESGMREYARQAGMNRDRRHSDHAVDTATEFGADD